MKSNYQLIIPFSDKFPETWELWKEYKKASHGFKYKSVFSEQAALEQLVTLSKGDEEIAVKIIKQSMRREWQGLFPLHETTTGNGKSTEKSNSDKGSDGVKNSAIREFIRRNGGGESQAGSDHLKAV